MNEKIWKRAELILFVFYLILGCFWFDDYGCGPDEGMERQTSLVNFRYACEKLGIPLDEANRTWLAYLPELHEYRDRYYGTALHFPLVVIESLTHFTMEPVQFYGIRHFYTFLNYYAGVICFYLLLSKRFGSRKYGVAGALMLILSPRFFAESFYNNKDIIFVAWYMICTFLMNRWFRKKSISRGALLAFALALTINTRFNGIVLLAVFIFGYLLDLLRTKDRSGLPSFFLTVGLTVVFFYLITPNFWEAPAQTFIETLQFNMRHPNHGSEGNLFKGTLVDAARTYTFIPVWIALTVPTVYLLCSVVGTLVYLRDVVYGMIHDGLKALDLNDLCIFIAGFGAVAFIILTHVTIYNGWRHCYFAYPCMVFFAVYFLQKVRKGKPALFLKYAVYLGFVINAVWIARNHPYEYVYFAPAARQHAAEFSGDYWSISSRALLEYIVQTDPERMLTVNHIHSQAGSINRGLLPEEKRQYLELTYDETENVDYYIVCRDDIPTVDILPKEYEKVFSIRVDEDEIGAVFKKRD